MKKKKRITIRHPNLVNLRNNLRSIIIQAVVNRKKELLDKRRLLWKGKEITPEAREKLRILRKQIDELRRSLRISICECAGCGRSDTDMIFHPRWKAWYCPQSYEASIKYKPPPHESEFDDN